MSYPRLRYPVILFFLACGLFQTCRQHSSDTQIRPELLSMFNEVSRVVDEDEYHEFDSIWPILNKTIYQHWPLTRAEKLRRFSIYHWYYTTRMRGDYVKANRIADSALTLFDDESFKRQHLNDYGLWMLYKGDALVQLKQLNEAFEYYYQVKTDYLDQWTPCDLSEFTSRLGFVRYKQGNYPDAIRYYLQAYEQHAECAPYRDTTDYFESLGKPQGMLNSVAWCYELMNRPDSAAYYYEQALNLLDREAPRFPKSKKGLAIARAVIQGNLGGLLGKLGRYDEAVTHLSQSIAVNRLPEHDQRDVQTAQIKLADIYITLGKFNDAQQLLADCRVGLDTMFSDDYELRWRRTYWRLKDLQGDQDEAYRALKSYHRYSDSLHDVNSRMFSTDFSQAFAEREQQLAYARLVYKNKINYISLLVSIAALILVLAIVYLIYINWRRSRLHIRRLNALNDRINQRNAKLNNALLALQDSYRENARIMAMVAHDLKNPLANIKMGLEYLEPELENLASAKKPFLEIIQKSNQRALSLIHDLVSGYGADNSRDDLDTLRLDTMLQDCVDAMGLRADKKELQLTFSGAAVSIQGNYEKIWRVMSNLIDNAIKFTPRGGKIEVRLKQVDDQAIIEVQDNGDGIPADLQSQMFEVEQLDGRPGTEGEPTTGLGLAIVKRIVSAHGGRIRFTSSPGCGTTFYVHLPCEESSANP